MILLNFAQSVLSHGVVCQVKCNVQCEFIGYSQKAFDNCVKKCESQCGQLSNDPFYKCISNCHLMKSATINNEEIGEEEDDSDEERIKDGDSDEKLVFQWLKNDYLHS
ncbi:uncharacterized protein HKW66_Vig0221080 [Vigna angularis]|uniref:Knottin scorpion toxin-like domain-containing protein n=1 Tax=Phaseolus angularis TaxID=3914 RepID=A0A8T0K058_PHAAN|nr:uncharacterized protein HKW66_Vig0221080 [Vigna angularis]